MINEFGRSLENETTEPYGRNVTIRNHWIRHAQKSSGEVLNQEGTGVADSTTSPAGEAASKKLGEELTITREGMKGYTSRIKRTGETLDQIIHGLEETVPEGPIRQKRVAEELTFVAPKEWLAEYKVRFEARKTQLLSERGLTSDQFANLSADEQEIIAEAAEEVLIREWIDEPDSQLAKGNPALNSAARFARLFVRHHNRLAQRLKSGSEIDLLHVTHKGITEPFLASGVLIRETDGHRITKLDELGGSLELLGQWESTFKTDSEGQSTLSLSLRGQNYRIDSQLLNELAHYGLQPEID